MEIRINSQTVDITLDVEKTVLDVEKSMSEWAAKRDLILTGIIADGTFYMTGKAPQASLDEVEVLDLQIQSRVDLIISSLSDGIRYCDRITSYVEDAIDDEKFDMSDLEPFYSGIDWLLDITQSSYKQLDLDVHDIKHLDKTVAEYLGDINMMAASLKNLAEEKDASTVIAFLNEQMNLFSAFKGIFRMALLSDNIKQLVVKSIDSPDALIRSLHDSREKLPEQLENLENISEAFQSGRDADASSLLQSFLDFMHVLTRSAIQTAPVFAIDPGEISVDGVSLDEKNAEINDLLSEVVTAMENDDIISVSDILEYELKPSLEPMPEYITQILDKIS